MLVQQFMRIPEFAQVPPTELRALAVRSHVLCVPEKRWLIRAGRHIDAYFYLLKGSVETHSPRRKWRAHSFGRLQHFYPGCSQARTLGACQVLRVDAPQRDFLLKGGAHDTLAFSAEALAEQGLTQQTWLQKFLSSQMMQQLSPRQWQAILTAFELHEFSPGKQILCRGGRGDYCYVLESGHAVVHCAGVTLAHLCPGDFFGEDALVLDSVRNADVSALEDVRVHAVHRDVFTAVLLENLVQFVTHKSQGTTLCLDAKASHGLPIKLSGLRESANSLDPRRCYYVCGGERSHRALAALLLLQRGLKVYPLE